MLQVYQCLSVSIWSRCQRNSPTAAAGNEPPGSEKANTLSQKRETKTKHVHMHTQDKLSLQMALKLRIPQLRLNSSSSGFEVCSMLDSIDLSSIFPGMIPFFLMCVYAQASACQPVSLPATAPAPKPAGPFALWLQFPGMPNLRQLLRTCYLRQQSASSAHHITRLSVSI